MGCLLLRKGVEKQADKKVMRDFTVRFWKDTIEKHLIAEEQVLLPYLVKNQFNKQYLNMIERDHETIRLIAERITSHSNGYTIYGVFAGLLEAHIRFEERVVFEKAQEKFSSEQLHALNLDAAAPSSRQCTDYPVKFWE